ncbi:MAG: hypothetical protein WBL74_14590 [Novosphingobium sp.]|uniref:hypothetical protein n=1 Tax=Novosphingobium sp. TaxID=1874826 RepID=UPI003C7A8088
MTTEERVLDAITRTPNMTELELALRLFGKNGVQQQVNPSCRALIKAKKVKRSGRGGRGDPFTYTRI